MLEIKDMLEIMTVLNILVPCILILSGLLMKGQTDRSKGIGFKTGRAMESDEAFSFANRLCGRLWIMVGAAMLVLTAVGFFSMAKYTEKALLVLQALIFVVQVTAAVCAGAYTEGKLKKRTEISVKEKEE